MSTATCVDPCSVRVGASSHRTRDRQCIMSEHVMTSDTIELVERVRRRLTEHDNPCKIAGPVSEESINAAEEALGITFPPSYRSFLRTWGWIAIPPHLGVVHEFVGVAPSTEDVVQRTLSARAERRLA